ncbi:MAG TPA: hypothetical protein VJU61_16680, partial [Polyangiaceae bacterium]|nr:hypothetical protein [Polyangiaceae bacterium]
MLPRGSLETPARPLINTDPVRAWWMLALGLAPVGATGVGCGNATSRPSLDATGAVEGATPADAGKVSGAAGAGGSSAELDAGRGSGAAGAAGSSVPFDPETLVGIPWDPPFTGRLAFAVTAQLQIGDET